MFYGKKNKCASYKQKKVSHQKWWLYLNHICQTGIIGAKCNKLCIILNLDIISHNVITKVNCTDDTFYNLKCNIVTSFYTVRLRDKKKKHSIYPNMWYTKGNEN